MNTSIQPSSFSPVSIRDLRQFFTSFGGFSGGWAVKLEGFERGSNSTWKVYWDNGLAESLHGDSGLANFQYISTGEGKHDKHVVVSYNWPALVARVKVDALREKMGQ